MKATKNGFVYNLKKAGTSSSTVSFNQTGANLSFEEAVMKRRQIILMFMLGLLITSCISGNIVDMSTLSAEEREYLNSVKAMSTTFTVSKDEESAAWASAQGFIGRYATMKVQTSTDNTIETFNPIGGMTAANYGYAVTKFPIGDEIEFQVRCEASNVYLPAESNAKILAYFIKTGKKMDKFINAEF
ncbi:hypothetical protein WDW89_22915 [Deltaproteobacteria bacterium TL4]